MHLNVLSLNETLTVECLKTLRIGFIDIWCLYEQNVFVTHYAPGDNKVQKDFFKPKGHSQHHKVMDLGLI